MITNFDENLLNEFEKRRKKVRALQVFKIVFISSLAPVFIVFLILFIVRIAAFGRFDINSLALFTAALIIGLAVFFKITFYAIKKKRIWKREFKQQMITEQFSQMFENITYQQNHKIDPKVIKYSNIIREGEFYDGEDYILATYKDVKFERCDLKVKSKNSTQIFHGQWMIFDFNKRIDAYVRIIRKRDLIHNNNLGMIVAPHVMLFDLAFDLKNESAKKKRVADLIKVQLEDIRFNNNFTVETTDEHTAFYLITPMVIEAINYLDQKLSGKLMIAFCDGKLHVALHSKENHFEPQFNKKTISQLDKIKQEAQIIHQFIDKLRLDNNYFSLTK